RSPFADAVGVGGVGSSPPGARLARCCSCNCRRRCCSDCWLSNCSARRAASPTALCASAEGVCPTNASAMAEAKHGKAAKHCPFHVSAAAAPELEQVQMQELEQELGSRRQPPPAAPSTPGCRRPCRNL